jgi:hypothetical protein
VPATARSRATVAPARNAGSPSTITHIDARPDVFFGGFGGNVESLLKARLFHEAVLRNVYMRLAGEEDPKVQQSLNVALAVARENYGEARRLEERILALIHVWMTNPSFDVRACACYGQPIWWSLVSLSF